MASPLEMYSKFGLANSKLDLLTQMMKIGQKMANGRLLFQALAGMKLSLLLNFITYQNTSFNTYYTLPPRTC